MKPADRDCVLVADLAAKRPRLGETNMVRLARRPAADDAGLLGTNFRCFLSRSLQRSCNFWMGGSCRDGRAFPCRALS